ncbi:helix-turn-helix domain-containing protein [Sphingobium sp. HBC34]|uniref:Helix-turn-helix domain-containing protein n=1 Tax=Sphingobium cyanobacteriorum TaxID=3063954 RepID=A0ABT8ZNR3_9SPHN|nr:helix-turn-helix domain-containing protein [Sphingobium sp. HBC34]MDO7836150.1 helix-turn-helix domain-containing protein [Sphingobium sp. HBC34]
MILSTRPIYSGMAADGIGTLAEQMARHGSRRNDPVRRLMNHLGDRWSVLILLVLEKDNFRYANLQKVINRLVPPEEKAISRRMLTLRLREMEAEGLIRRTVRAGKSVQVDYALTPFGLGYTAQVRTFIDWIVAGPHPILSATAFHSAFTGLGDSDWGQAGRADG